MHLQLNQRLQEVASYKRDKFKPEELDMALNKAMFRLLEAGVANKFEDEQINLSQVTGLIQKNKARNLIIPAADTPLYEYPLLNVYATVPSDLYWLVNARAEIVSDPLECAEAPALTTTNLLEYTAVVPFPTVGTAPYWANTTVSSTTLGTLYTAPTPIAAGFNSQNSKYVVINNIKEYMYRTHTAVTAYWERYRDVYYKDSFIFVGTSPIGTVTISSNGNTSSNAFSLGTYSTYNRGAIASLASKEVDLVDVRIGEENLLYSSMKNNQFYDTGKEEVLGAQTLDYFILYRKESFLITRLYLDYIRKPRTISLSLNQSCELADTAHPKIIDLAVEILRLDTKDLSYQMTVQDTQLRTN